MTLVQFQYVLAVAEHKNFTVAADKSFVTQPTLSMQIQKLEKELNIDIFDRTSHPIKITQIGEKIVAQAKTILMEANRMKHLVNEEKGLLEGDFVIGVIPTVLPSLVPLFYKTFQKNNPKSNLIIKELQTDKIVKGLKDGSLDFGIIVSPLYEDQLIERPLYYEPLVAYVPNGHRLASHSHIVETDLDTADLLILQEGHCFRNNVLALCDASKMKQRPIKLESGSFEALVKLSNDGYGMTLLPALVADDLPKEYKQFIKNFESPVPTREVSLVFHQSQLRDSFEKELMNTIQSILRGKIFLEKDQKLDANMVSLPKK